MRKRSHRARSVCRRSKIISWTPPHSNEPVALSQSSLHCIREMKYKINPLVMFAWAPLLRQTDRSLGLLLWSFFVRCSHNAETVFSARIYIYKGVLHNIYVKDVTWRWNILRCLRAAAATTAAALCVVAADCWATTLAWAAAYFAFVPPLTHTHKRQTHSTRRQPREIHLGRRALMDARKFTQETLVPITGAWRFSSGAALWEQSQIQARKFFVSLV